MLTPAERNRVRSLRDAIDNYERSPSPEGLTFVNRRAQDLSNAGLIACAHREFVSRQAADKALDELRDTKE